MFAWVIAISALGGEAADLTGGKVRWVIGYLTPMAVGTVLGLWAAKR